VSTRIVCKCDICGTEVDATPQDTCPLNRVLIRYDVAGTITPAHKNIDCCKKCGDKLWTKVLEMWGAA